MKIIILNWRDIKNPLSGGAEISLFEHAKYWAKKGAEVTWFAASYKNAKSVETIDGIKMIRKGSAYTVHAFAGYYFLSGKLGKPDLVIDSFHGIPFFSLLFIPRKKVIALINEIAGKIWFINANILIASVGFLLEKIALLFYRSQPFITGSESTKKELVATGMSSNVISVVHHGTHILTVPSTIKKEEVPTVIFLGRVTKDKGIEDALEVFSKIKTNISDVQLWIAGGEEKKGTLAELLNQFSDKDREAITYFGFVDEKKKFELFKKSWILIHPSIKEGWGLTVIEAASQGTPTIGYEVAGLIDSVQNGKTGLLTKPGDTEALANSAILLLNDKTLYKNLSKNAVQWSGQFTWETSTRKSWDILTKVHEHNTKHK